jgi:uncharacterized protein (TIGR02453 family)
MISSKSFSLFAELEANNNKEWFNAHRDDIHQAAVLPLTTVLEQASKKLASTAMPLSGGSKTLFRINRDIRFSQNKAPYKTQVSGLLTPDGSKAADQGVAYLQLDQNGGHMSAGYYNLTPETLKRIRDRIVEHPAKFRAVLDELAEANLELTTEMSLIAMPKGYAQYANEWFAKYVKFKVFLVRTKLSKEVWANGKVVPAFVDQTLTCASLIRFGQSKGAQQ